MTIAPTRAELISAADVATMKGYMGDQADAIKEMVGGAAATTLTIAAGSVTPTLGCHLVDTEAASASDDLTNIVTTNHPDGRFLVVSMVDAARVVTVKHNAGGAGQIALSGSSDVVLSVGGWLLLKRTGANWEEVFRSQSLISKLTLSAAVNEAYATVASHATTADIWSAKGNVINFTGTATVTAFPAAPQAGTRRRLICAGACSFTSSVSLVVDGGNYAAAAGDVVDVEAVTTTSFKLHPIPVGGHLLKTANLSDLASASTSRTNLGVYSTAQVDALVASGAGTITVTAGEAIDTSANPKLVYKDVFNQRGSGASRWYLVDSDATGPVKISPVIGFATTSAASAGNTFTCQITQGQVSGFSGLTADTPVWATSTAGAITQTVPAVPSSGAQNAVRVVGYAVSATVVMFEPWHDTVFQARNSALTSGSSVTVEHFPDSGSRERPARGYIAAASGYVLVAQADGTAIGNMTRSSAAFDGNTSQAHTSSAWYNSGSSAYVGKQFSSAQAVTRAVVYPSNNQGYAYAGGVTGTVTVAVYGKATSPSSETDGTLLGSNTGANSNSGTITVDFANSTAYAYVWVKVSVPSATEVNVSEVMFYTSTTARDEPLTIGSETVNSSATDRLTVKFADSSDGNQDTKTTFYNRTNATRDIIAEVTL